MVNHKKILMLRRTAARQLLRIVAPTTRRGLNRATQSIAAAYPSSTSSCLFPSSPIICSMRAVASDAARASSSTHPEKVPSSTTTSSSITLRPVKTFYGNCSVNLPRLVHHFRRSTMLSPAGTTPTRRGHSSSPTHHHHSTATTGGGAASSSSSSSREFRYELQYPSGTGGKHASLLKASHDAVLAVVMIQVIPTGTQVAVFGDGTIVAFGGGHGAESFATDLAELRQFLSPFSESKDPMLVLKEGRSMSLSMKYTTVEDVQRYHGLHEPSLMAYATGQQQQQRGNSPQSTEDSSTSYFYQSYTARSAAAVGGATGKGSAINTSSSSSSSHRENLDEDHSSYVDEDELHAIILRSATPAEMLPFAFCLSELCQLRALNGLLLPIADEVGRWKAHLVEAGTLPMRLQDARKRKAEVMRMASRQGKMATARHKLFWEGAHARSRSVLQNACEHYDVPALHEEIKAKTDAVTRTLGYLCEEGHADTNHHLEWIVIALIFVEVLISLQEHVFSRIGEQEEGREREGGAPILAAASA